MSGQACAPAVQSGAEERAAASFTDAPVLRSGPLTLEPIRPDHAAGLLTAADDDEVFAHLRVRRPSTLSDASQLVRSALALREAGSAVTWVQVVDAEVAGVTTFYDLSPATRSLAIGSTWLARRWQRTGVNRRAKLLLLRRAFDTLGCVRVVWHVDERNAASRTAVRALGATEEGLLRKHRQRLDGSWRTTVQFAMTDTDWQQVHPRLAAGLGRPLRRPAPTAPPAPPREEKNWTFVLDRGCAECGYRPERLSPVEAAERLRALGSAWRAVLLRAGATTRPEPLVWSPVEYACHVRDLCRLLPDRLRLIMRGDGSVFDDWDQDRAAVEGDYWRADPVQTAAELDEAVRRATHSLAGLPEHHLSLAGCRSDGSRFTVSTLIAALLHEVDHHLHDAEAQRR